MVVENPPNEINFNSPDIPNPTIVKGGEVCRGMRKTIWANK